MIPVFVTPPNADDKFAVMHRFQEDFFRDPNLISFVKGPSRVSFHKGR